MPKDVTAKTFTDKEILAKALWLNGIISHEDYSDVINGRSGALFDGIHDAMTAIANNEYGTGEN